jgi:hypothetical protein
MSVWVVNTSSLVFLGHLGRLELLQDEGREVYIPRAVVEEVAQKPIRLPSLYKWRARPGCRCEMSLTGRG